MVRGKWALDRDSDRNVGTEYYNLSDSLFLSLGVCEPTKKKRSLENPVRIVVIDGSVAGYTRLDVFATVGTRLTIT
jgi:hypothetical protein